MSIHHPLQLYYYPIYSQFSLYITYYISILIEHYLNNLFVYFHNGSYNRNILDIHHIFPLYLIQNFLNHQYLQILVYNNEMNSYLYWTSKLNLHQTSFVFEQFTLLLHQDDGQIVLYDQNDYTLLLTTYYVKYLIHKHFLIYLVQFLLNLIYYTLYSLDCL